MTVPPVSSVVTEQRRGCRTGDRGFVLLAVLLLAVLLTAVGTAIALVADTDILMTAAGRDALVARNAGEGVAALMVQELSRVPDWTPVLRGAVSSSLTGSTLPAATVGRTSIDLAGETRRLQQESYGDAPWAANTPQWQLYAWGVPERDLPVLGLASPAFLLGWVADDAGEEDGDPSTDVNGVVIVRVRVLGTRATRLDVHASIERVSPGVVRLASWRVQS